MGRGLVFRRRAAVRRLEVFARQMSACGYRCVRLYRVGRSPVLWVYARGPVRDVGVAVSAWGVVGRRLAYVDVERGPDGHLFLCDDVEKAAEQVDLLLKHRMFPGTW